MTPPTKLVLRLGHRLPNLGATVGAFIGEVDLRHAPMWCDVLDVHRKALTAWTDHEGWFGVVMVDICWHVGSPIRHSPPRPETSVRLRCCIIMMSCERRGNDRAFPARVTILHDPTPARRKANLQCRLAPTLSQSPETTHGHTVEHHSTIMTNIVSASRKTG